MSMHSAQDAPSVDLLAELTWRGLLHDATPALANRLGRGAITGYVGFDPTAPSLQVGNLVPLMLLAHLQRGGGKPIVLMGGGTGLIGDPSGKRSERPLLDEARVADNVARQRRQFERFLTFTGSTAATILNNAVWLRPLNLVEFLRDIGKHFTLSYMLQKESVKGRMEGGISYTEFSYMLLQAYDFLELFRTTGCELQMGGSDQWGNITAGIELIRRVDGGEAHGLAAPLLATAGGAKFGKSEAGSVWLDAEMTPPHDFYNFWVNADDRDVEAHLNRFTFKPREAIAALMSEHRASPDRRIPHHALAEDLTARVHGTDTAMQVAKGTRRIFHRTARGAGDVAAPQPPAGNAELLADLLGTVPTVECRWSHAAPPSIEDLVVAAGLAKSKSEARRLMVQGGLHVNEQVGRSVEPGKPLGREHLIVVQHQPYVLLRKGKKTYRIVSVRFTG